MVQEPNSNNAEQDASHVSVITRNFQAVRSNPEGNNDSVMGRSQPSSELASNSRVNLTSTEAAMLASASNVLGGSSEIRAALTEFATSAKALQGLLADNQQVHCFVCCASGNEVGNSKPTLELFTIVSELFHKALCSGNVGMSVTSQILRDAFIFADRSIKRRTPAAQMQRDSVRTKLPMPNFTLPGWFPYSVSRKTNDVTESAPTRTVYLFCRERVMREILKLDTNEIADVYATFFKALSDKGHTIRLVPKSITYSRLTPPYLRVPVVFMHGLQRSRSLPFTQRVLPNKNQIREKNGKVLGAAILDVWMKNEPSTKGLLLSLFQSKRIQIPRYRLVLIFFPR